VQGFPIYVWLTSDYTKKEKKKRGVPREEPSFFFKAIGGKPNIYWKTL
jgi:hypothetical protein